MLSPTVGTSQDTREAYRCDKRPRVGDATLSASHRIRLQCILQNRKVQVKEGLLESLHENIIELCYAVAHINASIVLHVAEIQYRSHYVLSICD